MDREYNKMLDLLVRSLDQELPPEEAALLSEALQKSGKLQLEKQDLLRLRKSLQDWQPAADLHFTARLLKRLGEQAEEDLSGVIVRLFPRVAAACVLILFAALSITYFTEGSLMMETIIGVDEVMTEDAFMLVENGF